MLIPQVPSPLYNLNTFENDIIGTKGIKGIFIGKILYFILWIIEMRPPSKYPKNSKIVIINHPCKFFLILFFYYLLAAASLAFRLKLLRK